MNGAGKLLRLYWQQIVGIGTVVLLIGNLYWDVERLKKADNTALMNRIKTLESRVNDSSLTDWSAWRATINLRVKLLEDAE